MEVGVVCISGAYLLEKQRKGAGVEQDGNQHASNGAAKMGLINKDHPIVAALPPQSHDE